MSADDGVTSLPMPGSYQTRAVGLPGAPKDPHRYARSDMMDVGDRSHWGLD